MRTLLIGTSLLALATAASPAAEAQRGLIDPPAAEAQQEPGDWAATEAEQGPDDLAAAESGDPAAARSGEASSPPMAAPRRAETLPPPPEPEDKDRFVVSIAPVYGHNFLEDDENETQGDLAGLEFTFNALPGFLGGLSLKQGVFHSFNAVDEGFAGRSVLSLDFAPDLGVVRPRLSLNGGGVYGHGVQDGFVVGPELALDINLFGGFTLRPKVAYDYQFRNPDWDEGILWGGLDLGIRF